MKIILTEDQCEQLTEMIKLDIKVGDTIMGGKFKNKKVVVKTIGKNDKGDITINGKPLLRFRIIKESNTSVLRRQKRMGISENINESNEKNKNFLKDKFGIDLDGKIRMIQSYEDLPLMFASHFYPKDFNRMLNDGGPFYVLNINKGYKIGNQYVNKLYLYRPRVDGSSYLVDQDGYNKAESTFLENLGVDIIGLTIKDLVDIYFEESINEHKDNYK